MRLKSNVEIPMEFLVNLLSLALDYVVRFLPSFFNFVKHAIFFLPLTYLFLASNDYLSKKENGSAIVYAIYGLSYLQICIHLNFLKN